MIEINFEGKNVLVTGGASGAGVAIVKQFVKTGANIIFTYNHSENEANELVRQLGSNVKAYHLDQSVTKDIPVVIDQIVKENGRIDILVNNAGIYPAKDLFDITEEDFDDMLNTNTKSTFFLNRYVYQNMKEGGSIVNISSINATNPAGGLTHYGTSKAAVEMLTKCLAMEFGPKVRVNCIAPGLIYKKGQEQWIPGWTESYKERSPLHSLVYGEDIGNTAITLSSDLSRAITGQIVTVDCGIMLTPCFDNSRH